MAARSARNTWRCCADHVRPPCRLWPAAAFSGVLVESNSVTRAPRAPQVGSDGDVTVIDSRCGEDFLVYQPPQGLGPGAAGAAIAAQFDACASWWTQVR